MRSSSAARPGSLSKTVRVYVVLRFEPRGQLGPLLLHPTVRVVRLDAEIRLDNVVHRGRRRRAERVGGYPGCRRRGRARRSGRGGCAVGDGWGRLAGRGRRRLTVDFRRSAAQEREEPCHEERPWMRIGSALWGAGARGAISTEYGHGRAGVSGARKPTSHAR